MKMISAIITLWQLFFFANACEYSQKSVEDLYHPRDLKGKRNTK